MITLNRDIVNKYNVAGPRYTSYPTAVTWTDEVTEDMYIQKLKQFAETDKTLSLYIHIPFCQSMCSFCACSVLIRKKEDKFGDEYLRYLFKEIELVSKYIKKKAKIKQLHWGGGTPTFLTNAQITRLFRKLEDHFEIDFNSEIAIEIDPRTIDYDKLKLLRSLGFNRVSMGVQDFDSDVQKKINRIQPLELVERTSQWCRELKFYSLNYDLIYGLPAQTTEKFSKTINRVIDLKPDRIALYSFAYVPWLKKHQTKIAESDLPDYEAKLTLFLNSREQLTQNNYNAIAMDHFALDNDELSKAYQNNALYRNFMGYTVKPADEFIGLGLTSIGYIENTFTQNQHILHKYYASLNSNHLPIAKGKILMEDDLIRQWVITSLMCHFKINKKVFFENFKKNFDSYFYHEQKHINDCIENGLMTIMESTLNVTELGKIFIRNMCMGFDNYLKEGTQQPRFSKTI